MRVTDAFLAAYLPHVVSLSGESLLLNITYVNNPVDLRISQDFWKWFSVKSPCLKCQHSVSALPEETTAQIICRAEIGSVYKFCPSH